MRLLSFLRAAVVLLLLLGLPIAAIAFASTFVRASVGGFSVHALQSRPAR